MIKFDRVHVMREAVSKLTQILAGKNIVVTQAGVNAYVLSDKDGKPVRVNIPYIPDNATEELINAIQGFLDHEVAHVLFTDFKAINKAAQSGDHFICNLLEDTRIEREMANAYQGSAENLKRVGQFALDKFIQPELDRIIAESDLSKLPNALMMPLIRSMAGQTVFEDYMADKLPMVQEIYDAIKHLQPKIRGMKSTADALTVTREIRKALTDANPGTPSTPPPKPKAKPAPAPAAAPGEEGEDDEAEPSTTPAGKTAAKKPEEAKEEEEKESEASADPEDEPAGEDPADDPAEEPPGEDAAEEPAEDPAGEDEDPPAPGEEEPSDSGAGEEEPSSGGFGADGEGEEPDDSEEGAGIASEPSGDDGKVSDTSNSLAVDWSKLEKEGKDFDNSMAEAIANSAVDASRDSDYLVYTTENDVVEPLSLPAKFDDRLLTGLKEEVDHMVAPLQKDLERAISAKSLSSWNNGLRSGRLSPSNLSRLSMNDPRVFRRKVVSHSKDVAVELVVDMSGSMGGPKINTAAQTAYALASTLERVGIKCEVICFTTGGFASYEAAEKFEKEIREAETKLGRKYSRRESLFMPVLKGFEERMTPDVQKRFAWLPQCEGKMNSNVDGESVLVAARRLAQRREAGKILMVLSDGQPACYGDTRALRVHLKKTVERISMSGITVLGIGIQSNAVEEYYPRRIVMNNVKELPTIVMKELRALLA